MPTKAAAASFLILQMIVNKKKCYNLLLLLWSYEPCRIFPASNLSYEVILLFFTLYWSQSISAGILRLTHTRNCAGRVHLWDNATYLLSFRSIYAIQYILFYIIELSVGSCNRKVNLMFSYVIVLYSLLVTKYIGWNTQTYSYPKLCW